MTPIDVSLILKDRLWNRVESAVLTSATLSNSGGFGYIKSRLGMEEAIEAVLDSPFDFRNQTLLYVPADLDPPSESQAYADAVASRIAEILEASAGRAFLLFTSYRMLNAVHERLSGRLPFKLLRQGEMSNDRLLNEFRKHGSACLFGVHSFWEGVDVKGEALSCVIIDKLPFAVPDSPVNKARVDALTAAGQDWFTDYAMPQAQIRLKQGFGRLIRTTNDRGAVCVLDSRLLRKSYGSEFLRCLPRTRRTANLEEVREFFAAISGAGRKRPSAKEENAGQRRKL
jgi:ATP-dependent DNA helicase DinG